MFFFNLSAAEFFAIFGAVSALVVGLYLLSRSRKRIVVATLQFWIQARHPVENQQRRRIQQPWSLLLQLLGIALLLLAIAQLRLGAPDSSSRDHVLIVDTSSWSAARSGRSDVLTQAKLRAHEVLKALPATDRVMIVRADSTATPVTGMESDRSILAKAIDDCRPGAAALNLENAFSFADQIRRRHVRRAGEIIYVGGDRIAEHGAPQSIPAGLRLIPMTVPLDNAGFQRIGLRRSPDDPEMWEALVSVHNFAPAVRRVPVVLLFGGAPAGTRMVVVDGKQTVETSFRFRARAAGWIEARILTTDGVAEDNRAILELPALTKAKVVVYSDTPELLRPALLSGTQMEPVFRSTAQYTPEAEGAKLIVLDRFVPAQAPSVSSVWIQPGDKSPFTTRTTVNAVPVTRWRAGHELTAGLRSTQLRLPSTSVFAVDQNSVAIAEAEAGPVIVARPKDKMIALGFHPGSDALRFELATPLLFANILRWTSPEIFQSSETFGRSVGTVSVELQESVATSPSLRVIGEDRDLPFTVQGRTLRFFSGVPKTVRVVSDAGEQVHSLSLPELGRALWEAPAGVRRGLPQGGNAILNRELWQILALVGAAILLAEWVIYGRGLRRSSAKRAPSAEEPLRKAS